MNKQLGQYKIVSEIGAGGMGVVYRAVDVLLEREVAIKRLRSEFAATNDFLERFRREAQLQAKLNHPNIAQLYTLLHDGENLCLVMELVDGTVLTKLMPMPPQHALPVLLQVLEALDYAHRRGVLHRDIKPDNIVVNREGTIKVMDFGIAHAFGAARITRDRAIVGTLEYTSPERILNQPMDPRSDIYSVGILLFEMISGHLPFANQSEYELLRAQVEDDPPPLSTYIADVPDFIQAAITRSLAKDPESRYASCADMATALRDGCAEIGWQLQSVADVLAVKLPNVNEQGQEIQKLCQRIESLIETGEFEAAKETADTAVSVFPGSTEIQQWREKVRTTVGTRRGSGEQALGDRLPEDETFLRQTLLRVIASEAGGDLAEALRTVEAALQQYPDRTAFRILDSYLRSRLAGGSR